MKKQPTGGIISQYKAHVLSFIKYRTPALYHSSSTEIAVLDKVQLWFLRELGLDPLDALLQFKLAPLETRRDLAMLGIIHRANLRRGPPWIQDLLRVGFADNNRRAGLRRREHFRAVHFEHGAVDLEIGKRSLLGLAGVYNILPEYVAEAETVSTFQSRLQNMLVDAATDDFPGWPAVLSPRHVLHLHPLLRL